MSATSQALAATGNIKSYPPVTVCTITSTGAILTLPTPSAGLEKTVVLDYTGATGAAVIACATTAQGLNGSTANIISVSSSEEHAAVRLVGMSASAWSVLWSVTPTTAAPGIAFAASTLS
ncbi:MAG: hypothetical protein QNL12_03255 [Acidimicrobiia bacterium]|nr:hypothetical protein [Acidimicrobiia bacterium]